MKPRTSLINFARAEVRMLGHSLTSCGSSYFASKNRSAISGALQPPLGPILNVIESLTKRIGEFEDRT